MKIHIPGAPISARAWTNSPVGACLFCFQILMFHPSEICFLILTFKILHWNIIYLDSKLFWGGNSLKKFALKEKPLACSLVLTLHLGLLQHLSFSFSASAMSLGPAGLFGSSDLHRECFFVCFVVFAMLGRMAGIFVPWPGMEPAPPAVEGSSESLITGPLGKSPERKFWGEKHPGRSCPALNDLFLEVACRGQAADQSPPLTEGGTGPLKTVWHHTCHILCLVGFFCIFSLP